MQKAGFNLEKCKIKKIKDCKAGTVAFVRFKRKLIMRKG